MSSHPQTQTILSTENDVDSSSSSSSTTTTTTTTNRLPRLQSLISAIYDRYSDLSSNCCDNICNSSNENSSSSSSSSSNNNNSEEQNNFSSTSESNSTAGSPMNTGDVSGGPSGCGPVLTSSINDISFYMPICFSPRKTSMWFL
jgi:hypothetical protein